MPAYVHLGTKSCLHGGHVEQDGKLGTGSEALGCTEPLLIFASAATHAHETKPYEPGCLMPQHSLP